MEKNVKIYLREFGAAMLGYTILLPVSLWLVSQNGTSPWRFAFALLPVIPLLFALWALIRAINGMDEMQKNIQLQAFTFACAGTAFITFTYGLLQFAGLPPVNFVFIMPLLILLWGLGLGLASLRYK